jgi:TPR repeat protein
MKGEIIYLKAKSLHSKMYEYPNYVKEQKREKMYKQYLHLIRKAAYLGHPDAQYDLGQQYEDMNYLSIHNSNYNPKKCIYWYTKACLQNHAEACNNLAAFYETGNGCKKDLKKALSLYKKSSELGYSIGKKNYNIMLRQIQATS